MTDYIAEAITSQWGERCQDYVGDCHVCQAWKQYDELRRTAHSSGVKVKGLDTLQEAHKHWQAQRGGIGFACFNSAAKQERAFAKADNEFAFAASHVLSALSPAEAGVEGDAKPVAVKEGDRVVVIDYGTVQSINEEDENAEVLWDVSGCIGDIDLLRPAALTHPSLLEECREVLRPFAAVADTEDEVGREDPEDDRTQVLQAYGCQLSEMSIDDFRRARTLLTKLEAGR